ncbi:MAG: hypothetical protein HY735_08945 [Verrucomicrobia bacterium]|nr:hypothetical protein [Verrucomicrobiota bacterium]
MQKSEGELALENARLTEREKKQHRLIVRWSLGYCRKRQPSTRPGRDLANEFDRKVLRKRNPPDW